MAEAAQDGVETKDPSAPEGVSEEESAAHQTDYKALYDEEVKKAEQWKEAALKNKRLAKEAKTETSADETEDEKITRLASKVSERVVTTVTEDSLLKNKITDPEQRKLVKFYLENKIVRTGTSEEALERDIQDAIDFANSKKNAIKSKELERVINNDSRVTPAAGSSADRGVERKPYQWTPEQAKALEQKAKDLRLDPEKFKTEAWNNRSRTNVA
jgi:hypothetical protein